MLAIINAQCPDPLMLPNDNSPTLSFFMYDVEDIYIEKILYFWFLVTQ